MANVQTFVDALEEARKDFLKIESKYLALKGTIENLEKLIEVNGGIPKPRRKKDNASEIKFLPAFRMGAFEGMTTKPASLYVLLKASKPLRAKYIVDVLEKAGFVHESKNLINSLNTTLVRVRDNEGLVTRNDDLEWSLTDKGHEFMQGYLNASEHPEEIKVDVPNPLFFGPERFEAL